MELCSGVSYYNTSRVGKMEFPKFNSLDIEGRLYRCQQFFEFDITLEDSKIKLIFSHLEGMALHCHQQFMWTIVTEGTFTQ